MRFPLTLPTPPEYETVQMGAATARNATIWRPTELITRTTDFWYCVPSGVFQFAQRGNKAVGYSSGKLHYSTDSGQTWPTELTFADATSLRFCHIFENGNILFATFTSMYLSTDNLATYDEITLTDTDGEPYLPHTPANASHPGDYFHSFQGENSWTVPGVGEMLVFSSYNNVVMFGVAPSNIYYSTDNGATVKIAYKFGQNPFYRDNGTAAGSSSTGALLGDASNPIYTRHVHSVGYNPAENAFYACTGDTNRAGPTWECHWLRGTYDASEDEWAWTVVWSGTENSRLKAGGINFVNGQLYFIGDSSSQNVADNGIFRCDPADLADEAKHVALHLWPYKTAKMLIEAPYIVTGFSPVNSEANAFTCPVMFSADLGETWELSDFTEQAVRSPIRFHKRNAEGWFRCDLMGGAWSMVREQYMLIKPRGT